MRSVVFLLVFLLLPPLRTARAQGPEILPAPPSLAAVPRTPGTSTVAVSAFEPAAAWQPAGVGRDRGRGALYGAAIGALVGGVGFAATNYAFTTSAPRDEYTLLSFLLGAAAGGAAGAVVGAIIGVPERDETGPKQARLHFVPDLSRGGTVALSVSLPSR